MVIFAVGIIQYDPYMKKTILSLAILFSCLTASAQWFPLADVNFGHAGIAFQF